MSGPFGHISGFEAGAPFTLNRLVAPLSELSFKLAAASFVGLHPTPYIDTFFLKKSIHLGSPSGGGSKLENLHST